MDELKTFNKNKNFTGNIIVEADSRESWMCPNLFNFESYWRRRFFICTQINVTEAHSKLSGGKSLNNKKKMKY